MVSLARGVLIATTIFLAGSASASAITISTLPPNQTVETGDAVSVDLVITGLGTGSAPSLGVFDITVAFNPAILSFTNVIWGTELDLFGLGDVQSLTIGSGTLNLFELSLDSAADLDALQASDFKLATLRFTALTLGFSSLGLTVNNLGDARGAVLGAVAAGAGVDVESNGGPLIPEPATFSTMLLGITVVALRLRHRFRRE